MLDAGSSERREFMLLWSDEGCCLRVFLQYVEKQQTILRWNYDDVQNTNTIAKKCFGVIYSM